MRQGKQYSPQTLLLHEIVLTDYELAKRIGRGETASIDPLYERHQPKVYSLCLRMTGNTAEAEDLTQEVFIQLLTKVGSFRGESQFTTWLYRFTTNHVLMYFRRASRRRERFPYLADEISTVAQLSFKFGKQALDRLALETALAKLPPGSREVFIKFDIEGFNHEEIAHLFGCSVGNSKSQLHKARRKLREQLNWI